MNKRALQARKEGGEAMRLILSEAIRDLKGGPAAAKEKAAEKKTRDRERKALQNLKLKEQLYEKSKMLFFKSTVFFDFHVRLVLFTFWSLSRPAAPRARPPRMPSPSRPCARSA